MLSCGVSAPVECASGEIRGICNLIGDIRPRVCHYHSDVMNGLDVPVPEIGETSASQR